MADAIDTAADVHAALRQYKPGAKVPITLQRGGDSQTLTATLGQVTG